MSRIVAIDFGLKRTGIAVTDEMKMIASPLETINTHNLFTFLKDYFSRNNVEKIILGFPKDVDENAQIVIAIKKVFTKLKKEFKDKEIILHDERLRGGLDFASLFTYGYPLTSLEGITEIKRKLNKTNIENKIDIL